MEKRNFGIHITYGRNLTLKELSEVLNLINLSVNDYYRDNGINNFEIGRYAPSINGVKEGSIFFDIVIPIFETVCSEAITVETVVQYILSRLNKMETKKGHSPINLYFNINIGTNNTINMNVNDKNN